MKIVLTPFFIVFFCLSYAQNVTIPDANFKNYLLNNVEVNTNNDNEIQVSEANAFTGTLAFQFHLIDDLTGIEAFTNLSILDCGDNNLTSLDLSANTALTQLYCYDNNLTSLDVSANTALTALDCRGNMIINLTLNENLTYIQCTFNQIENLDVSQNMQLATLRCFSNNIMSLNLANNLALTSLYANNNNIEQLDLSNNSVLTIIECSSNNLTELFVDNSNNSNVTSFTALFNPNLECIQVDDVAYSEANWMDIDSSTEFSEDCSLLSIEEYTINELKIFPIPAKNTINVSASQELGYSIISITGEVIRKGELLSGNKSIDVANISKGIYFIAFESDEGVVTIKKWIKN